MPYSSVPAENAVTVPQSAPPLARLVTAPPIRSAPRWPALVGVVVRIRPPDLPSHCVVQPRLTAALCKCCLEGWSNKPSQALGTVNTWSEPNKQSRLCMPRRATSSNPERRRTKCVSCAVPGSVKSFISDITPGDASGARRSQRVSQFGPEEGASSIRSHSTATEGAVWARNRKHRSELHVGPKCTWPVPSETAIKVCWASPMEELPACRTARHMSAWMIS